jgi:L-fuculose-phosphate aldolase
LGINLLGRKQNAAAGFFRFHPCGCCGIIRRRFPRTDPLNIQRGRLQGSRKERSTMLTETRLREAIVWVCRRLERKGLVAASDGNVSCRLCEQCILITPSGRAKSELVPLDLLVTDLDGNVLRGRGKPSTEIRMHLLVYEKRPDVQAVVHAHPPLLTALSLAGKAFPAAALPEVWAILGPVPTAGYATPGTDEVPQSISPFVERHDAILLERHGVLTVAENLKKAYYLVEKMEHAAATFFYARLLSGAPLQSLPPGALQALKKPAAT